MAYYMDKTDYTVMNPPPSHSPEPTKPFTCCTCCEKGDHDEKQSYTKKNDQGRENARTNV